MRRLAHRIHRALQPLVGFLVLHRWPWPVWKLRGWGLLPLGRESFRFVEIDRPQYVWFAQMALRRRWETAVISELTRALRPGDVFFDVGAFQGAFTLLASRLVGPSGRVIAFEPDPGPRTTLERNLRANGVENVTVAPYAVGDHRGTMRFSASGDSVGHLSSSGEIEVQQVTLDSYCAEHNITPTVMKVDIEGAEAAALSDSDAVRGLRELVVEVHEPALRAQGVDPVVMLDGLGRYELLDRANTEVYGVLVRPRRQTSSTTSRSSSS
jgi:FkbM family methyltransferase